MISYDAHERFVDLHLPDGSVVMVDTWYLAGIETSLQRDVCQPTQDFGITEQL